MDRLLSALTCAVLALSPLAAQHVADPATYLSGLLDELGKRWPKNRTLRIVCHGHSVPAGYFKTPRVDSFNAYPHLLHQELKRRYPTAVINVIVTAIGGENSKAGAARFERDVSALRPDLVTIDYALNDRGLGVVAARSNLSHMVDACSERQVPVLLLTPTPDKRAKWGDPADPLMQQAAMIRDLARSKSVGLVDSTAAFSAFFERGGALADVMSQVNHPNRAGHDLVVGELLQWFGGRGQAFSVRAPSPELPAFLRRTFHKEIRVFGIPVLATNGVSDTKLKHAASVLAEYLDNDEDGAVDDEGVVQAMRQRRATLVMFETSRALEAAFDQAGERELESLDDLHLQDLQADETHPDGAARGVFDATLEETLHLVTSSGYAVRYPKAFGEERGSRLANAMDKARGGVFAWVPRRYPESAWFTYDDRTCDYGCQVTEYFYWALTSWLGGQEFPGRKQAIEHEWRANTRAALKSMDPDVCRLITDPAFSLPKVLPDGRYRPR